MEQNKDQSGAPVKGAFLDKQGKVVLCQDGKEEVCFGFASRLYANQSDAAVRGEAVAESEHTEQAQLVIDCMDAWAKTVDLPTYSELARAADAPSEPSEPILTMAQVNAIRDTIKPGDGWDGDNWDFALANAVAAAVKSRAADALDSQPTEPDGCAECRHTYCMSGEVCKACGDVAMQGWKGGRQPTDGGVRNGCDSDQFVKAAVSVVNQWLMLDGYDQAERDRFRGQLKDAFAGAKT